MDYATFTSKLAAFPSLPAELLDYATDVGSKVNDAGRDKLLAIVQNLQSKKKKIDDTRVKMFSSADVKIEAGKKEITAASKAVETEQREADLEGIESQLPDS